LILFGIVKEKGYRPITSLKLFQLVYLVLVTDKECALLVVAMVMCGLPIKRVKKISVKNAKVPERTEDIPVVVAKVLGGPMPIQIRQHQENDDLNSEKVKV